jgi:hypothetical protein
VEALSCAACATRDRKAWNVTSGRDPGMPPPFGEYFVLSGPNVDF